MRYHGVSAATACNLLTLTLTRANDRGPDTEAPGAAAGGAATVSSLTLAELPGTERLAEERGHLGVTEGPQALLGIVRRGEPNQGCA